MARAKFRPRRQWVDTYCQRVIGPTGSPVDRIVVGDMPHGIPWGPRAPDEQLRRGIVELQGGIYHGFVTCPYAAHKRHRSENWQRAFTGCVAVNSGRQLTFQVEKTADGSERLVGRLVANLQQANAIVGSWQGEIVFPGMPTA